MKTRLLFLSLSIFIASTTISHAQVATQGNNILGSIKYSDKTINKKIYTNTVVSITSYCYINDNTVALLDADEQKIVIYSLNDKSVSKTIYLPYSAIDFDYYSNKFYILDYDKVYIVNNNGIKESEINYRKPLGIPFAIEKFKVINGRNILNISDGTTWEIASDGTTKIDDFYWHYENGYNGRTEKKDLRSFELSVMSDNSISSQNLIDISSLGLSDYLATARIISINNNEIALDIETSNDIDNPRRFIILTDVSGNLISKTEIPFVYETDIKSPFCKYKSSISYCLSTPDGLYFYEINSQKKQINLPSDCPKKSHFNNNLPKNKFENIDNSSRVNRIISAGTNSVTRTQVYENAYKFRDLEWTATNANKLTSCTQITTGTYAKSPSWIVIGNNVSVPYKWGGYTDWSEFANLATQGKYTGNTFCTTQDTNGNVTYTNGVCSNISNTGSSIIGVDCSGFISRCWETGHYTTKSLPDISTSLGNSDIISNINKLQPGDIVNDDGSHVRLCLTQNSSGTQNFMEAAAGGSAEWRVSEKSYSYTQLAGYVCYKYKNINDARLRLAQTITISPTTVVQGNSLTATYKIGNYGTESWTGSVRLYIIQSDGDEIALQTQGPITLNANAISNTYSFTSTSVSSPAGATKLEVRVQNSNGNDYGRYYKVGASSYTNPLEFNISGCTAPSQPATISGNSTVCEGSNQTYSISAVSGATSYTWIVPNGWTYTENSTSISCKVPTGSTGGIIKACANNACGSSTYRTLTVTVNSLPATTTVNGGGIFCNSATLTANGGSGGTIYWQGTTSNGSSTATASSSQTVTASGTYYFRANNGCGWGAQGSAIVTINTIPAQPGTITGSTTVTSGNTYPYSISTISGATSYTWKYNGVTQSGSGTSITLSPTSSGTLSVIANNSCGSSSPTSLNIVVNALSISSNILSLSSTINSNGTISITSNTSWTASSNQSWLTVSPTSGSNNGTLTLTANSANTTTTGRTATITVSGTGVTSQTITVTQQGTSPSLSLSVNTLSLNSAINSNGTISITSNTLWTASSNQSWLTVSPTSGSNNGALTLTANSANATTTARTATVTVTGTGVSAQTITITQQGTSPSLSLSANTLSLNPAINSNGTITITSNTSWTASSNQSWLTVSPTSGSNNGALTLTANSANTTTSARTATVTVTGTGVTTQTITVTQQGTSLSLSLSANTLSLNSAINSNGTIIITSNTSWTASSNQSWLTASPTSGSNNGTLTLTANSANTTITARTATVTVTGTGVTAQTITVTQLGTGAALSLSANALSLNSAINSNGTISIISNTSWTASSNQTWLIVSPLSGSNNGTLTLTATSANATTSVRTANVTVSGTGVTAQTITISQQGIKPDITNGLVAYYPFDGNAIDASGNSNNGKIGAGNSFFIDNSQMQNNLTCKFLGTDTTSYVKVANSESLKFNSGQMTFSINVKLNPFDDLNNGKFIVSKTAQILFIKGGLSAYVIPLGIDSVKIGFQNENGVECGINIKPFNIGQWNHFVFRILNDSLNIYFNGEEVAAKLLKTDFNSSINRSDLSFGLGNIGGSSCLKGLLDEIKIYNRALSLIEIRTLYSQFYGETSIINIASNSINGSINGGGVFNNGLIHNVVATPKTGYMFLNWSENGIIASKNENYKFKISGNRSLIASFSQIYNISSIANPNDGGIVSGGGNMPLGQSCTVIATANSGYTFTNWTESGNVVSTNASYTFTVSGNRTLVANFNNGQITGLVAYYPFNGNANDESGNGNNGTGLVGGVSFVTGKYGQAVKFGGYSTPGHIRVPNSTSLQFTTGASFVYWVRLDNAAGMDGWGSLSANGNHCVFAKSHDRSGITNNMGYTSLNKLYSGLGSSDGGGVGSKVQGISGYTIGNWIHIAYSCSGTSNTLYVNGVQDSTTNTPLNFATSNTQDLYFGKFSDYWYPFNGALDEMRIYNRALNTTEIQQLYNRPSGIFDVNVKLLELSLYPNPTETFLQIFSPEILQRIEVCDIAGRLIFTKTINSDKCTLETNDYFKGIYIVKGFTNQGIITGRFVRE